MTHSMQTRTLYCPHGFQIPGKPEPWEKLRCKASRFCLTCWADHGQVFRANGFDPIETEDRIQYGFLDIIHFVLKDRAFYRDQDRFEFLETELRMHLWEKRDLIEKVMRDEPDKTDSYVRVALNRKLQDLQKGSEFEVERFSDSFDERVAHELADVDSEDEEERLSVRDPLKTGRPKTRESINALSYIEAYEAVKDNLLLRVLDEEPPALTERDIENMPSEEYKRRVLIPEFEARQRRQA